MMDGAVGSQGKRRSRAGILRLMDRKPDLPTVAAIAVIVYAVANVVHEGIGHGIACLFAGGRPLVLSSLHFESNLDGLPERASRIVAAGGTIANLVTGVLAVAWSRRSHRRGASLRYALWLFATLSLLQGAGYLMFSGIGNVGDWARVVRGFTPAWLWRSAMALGGTVGYYLVVRFAMGGLGPFVGQGAERVRRALPLTLIPYVAGGILYVASGLWNPHGFAIILISGVAASFGGASGLAWGAQLLRGDGIAASAEGPVVVERSWSWIAASAVVAALFVGVLGPGVKL